MLDVEVTPRAAIQIEAAYGHPIIDGREAVSFLVTLKQQLEDPARLLLDL